MTSVEPTRIRVRYSDVDRMGLLYHVNYLEYFEVGRSDWIRRLWKPYKEIEDAGFALVVIEAHLRFIRPGKYDDELELYVAPTEWGNSRIRFGYRLIRAADGDILCEGWTSHCFISSEGKPVRMPEELHRRLETSGTGGDSGA